MTTGANVDVEECSVPSYWRAIGPIVNAVPYVFNSSLGNAGFVQAGGTNQFGATGYQIIGGQEEPCGGYIIGDLVVDGDFVSNTNLVIGAGSIGTVYEDNCPALHITGVVQVTQSLYNGGVPVIYGPGLVAVYGGGHLYYPTGANKAATTFPIAQGINLDLNSHQLAADTTGDPVVWHLRTDNGHTFVLNLDKTIAAGGYGGGTSIMCAQGQGNFVCNIAP
jgi:hypothetical protein